MELIKKGKVDTADDWSAEVTCKECDAVMKIVTTDLKKFTWHGTHFPHWFPGVNCIACGVYIHVKDVPLPISEMVQKQEGIDTGVDDSIY